MKVSVSVITYNQEKYIAQALDSVLMQKTNFDFEILIGEDDSSDATRELVKEYQKRYPDKVRLFLNDRKNVIYINGRPTGRYNLINNLKNAQGKYIALLEGDDYWTDPLKLQKQADFLDRNIDCAACFHWVNWLDQSLGKIEHAQYGPTVVKPRYTLDDLLRQGNFMATCSVMFKNGFYQTFPDWFYRVPIGDLPLHVLNARHGEIGLVDEVMAVYRRHKEGVYGGQTQIDNCKVALQTYEILGESLELKHNCSYRLGVLKWETTLFNLLKRENRMKDFMSTALRALTVAPAQRKINVLIEILVTLLPEQCSTYVRSVIQKTKRA